MRLLLFIVGLCLALIEMVLASGGYGGPYNGDYYGGPYARGDYHSDINGQYGHGHGKANHRGEYSTHRGDYYKDKGKYNTRDDGQYYNNRYNNIGSNGQYQNAYGADFYGKHKNNNYVRGTAWGHSDFHPTHGLFYRKLYAPVYSYPW